MEHMTHDYMLGLVVLIISFIVVFYIPLVYAWIKIRAQQNNRKN